MDEHKQRVTQRFGLTSQDYATSQVHAHGESLNVLFELVQPQRNWAMLDVATGAGHTAVRFANSVSSVVASDLTVEMLKRTTELAEANGIENLETRLADAESLPFPDGSFDLLTCRLAYHHFQKPEQVLGEFLRVLKPGGIFGFTDNFTVDDHAAAEFYNRYESIRDPSHFVVGSVLQLNEQIQGAGFTLLESRRLTKEFEFQRWANRQRVTERDKEVLLSMMREIPEALRKLMAPRFADETMYFSLGEVVILAQRPDGKGQ